MDEDVPWYEGIAVAAPVVKQLCEANGIAYGGWETIPRPERDLVTRFGANFWIAEGERSADWERVTYWFRKMHPTVPAAIVTNFNLTDHDLTCLHLDQFDCLGESYTPENTAATPDAQAFEAQRRGWTGSRFQPVIEVNADHPLESYSELLKPYPNWWVYSAEYLLR